MRGLSDDEIKRVSGGDCGNNCYNQCGRCTKDPAVTPSYNPSPGDTIKA
jgi:hypothetical protein